MNPPAVALNAEPVEELEPVPEAPAEAIEILLVDDRPENLLALEAILEPLGHRLVRATSGEEALRALLEREFAVILLDVQMPGMSGFETAKMVKSRERTRYIPIIFLTAISKDEEYVFQGYEAGAVDYMSKPFQPGILRSKVQVFVEMERQRRRLIEQEQQLRERERETMEMRHIRELLQSEARFREILASAMDAIVVFDGEGVISIFNAAAERMFRTKRDETLGTPVSQFFPSEQGQKLLAAMCDTADRQRADAARGQAAGLHPQAFTAVRTGGEHFPVEASVSCLQSGETRTYTLIVRDVSDRIEHEQALQRQAQSLAQSSADLKSLNEELHRRQLDLERAMTARSRFYASMSHELRTPINAVLGYSTLLLERIYGALNDKQAEGIQRTQKAARHLLELVNDVLDLSKIEAGKIDLRLQPVEFPSLVDDLFVTVKPLADEHGSVLSIECTEVVKVISDPRRVRQVLLNLLSNAIKFGAGKPIRVCIEKKAEGGVAVSVTDEGPGIPDEDRERIFQEFVQLGRTQLQDGTGLGLPISRRLAELLSGSLTLESSVGKGSVFTLTLPATADTRGSAALEQEVITAPADERASGSAGDADPAAPAAPATEQKTATAAAK